MLENEFHISKLLAGYLKGELSPEEQQELTKWLESSSDNSALLNQLKNEDEISNALKIFQTIDKQALWTKIINKINVEPVTLKRNRFNFLSQIAAAALLITTLSIGVYFYSDLNFLQDNISAEDIKPGKNTATLTLSNGLKLVLTDSLEGQLAEESGVNISKTSDGQIIYTVQATNDANDQTKPLFNTLATTNGQKFQVILPDHSKVWLNSASSLKFPASFKGLNKRQVELSGEAYFEVAENKEQPFIVESRGQEVRVLGTHFNINAYADEVSSKTTLLKGSVKIDQKGYENSQVLLPGQQAVLGKDVFDVISVATESAIAWKNNYFVFENEDLKEIMRKFSRWYNVEVSYEGNYQPLSFTGSVATSKNLSEALRILELTGNLTYRMEKFGEDQTGRRIIIMM